MRILLAFALSLVTAQAGAQGNATPPLLSALGLNAGGQVLLNLLSPGATEDTYLRSLRANFVTLDADVNGVLDDADIDQHSYFIAASSRAQGAAQTMRHDLNGDGFVEADEVAQLYRYERRSLFTNAPPALSNTLPILTQTNPTGELEAYVKRVMAPDADGDGKVSFAEAAKAAFPQTQAYQTPDMFPARVRQLMTLDPEGKNSIGLALVESAGRTLFFLVDANHDGMISPQELAEYRSRPRF